MIQGQPFLHIKDALQSKNLILQSMRKSPVLKPWLSVQYKIFEIPQ